MKSAGQLLFEWANANIKLLNIRDYASDPLRSAVAFFRGRLNGLAEGPGTPVAMFPTGGGQDIIIRWPDDHNRIAKL